MTIHRVKSWGYLFDAIDAGVKKHDVRDMRDREYKVGDILILERFDQTTGEYTGETLRCIITYITNRNVCCAFSSAVLDRNFGILSLEKQPK